MPEYIERENAYKLISEQKEKETGMYSKGRNTGLNIAKSIIHDKERCPTADVVKVVRCKDCEYCKQLAPHCEFNRYAYFHCELWRGEETKNVWHKYKKYYADYSIVEPTDYCSYGELKEREG